MSRSKKKTNSKKKKEPVFDFAGMASFAGRIGGWVGLAALAGGLALSAGALESRVGEVRADPVRVEVMWPRIGGSEATWMPGQVRDRITRKVLASVSIDPTERESLEEARALLERSGWFSDGPTLERRPGGVITVSGVWREPAAVVEVGGEALVMARSGERLPLTYTPGGAGQLRFIRNAWGDAPAPGQAWGGDDVTAAIALLDLLRESEAWGAVAGVDARGYLRSRVLSVVTTEGARVVWGSAPNEKRAVGQVEQERRVQRFESLVNDPAWIGAGRPRVELHLPRPVINESAELE